MKKKTVFLELPIEMLEQIDRQNPIGDRSAFISEIIDKQLRTGVTHMDINPEIKNHSIMKEEMSRNDEFSLINNKGATIEKFDINTVEGFKKLAKIISEISDDPTVRKRARQLL